MRYLWVVGLVVAACTESTEECYVDDDCADGEVCVISHDHEGDDHDHGGVCELDDGAEG